MASGHCSLATLWHPPPTCAGDLVQLKDFVIAKALWDPTVDADALITDFLAGYYGDAAPFIRTYMDAMVAGIDNVTYYMHESFDINAPFLSPPLLLKGAHSFANGSKAVSAADVRFVRRVEQAAMPVMYVVLFRWDELKAYAASVAVEWPYNATKRPQFDEFKRRYQAIDATRLDEGGHTIDWMEKALFGSADVPSARAAAGLRVPSTHWPTN